jgi:argininosuccinate lyase
MLEQAIAGRLRKGPAQELVNSANTLEVSYAPMLYEGMSLADIAHVIMLMETEIVPRALGLELLGVLLEADRIPAPEFPLDPAWGDVYKNRERYVNQSVPEAGGWLRAGRARREATNIGYRLAVRWRLLSLLQALAQLAEVTVARAEEHADTVMPDYTYLQQAQPTTLGHYLLGFVYPMLRDVERLRACFQRINLSPGGIASVNGSRLPLDRKRLAELLGFDGIVLHTRDAMWQADTPIEITSAATALLVNLDRLAEDLQVWSTREFNLVELADGFARTSAIMPQKKNPYSLTYVRGLANVTIGHLVAMASVGRTPSGQPDNRIFAYGDVPRLLDQTREAVRLMAGVVGTLEVHGELMAQRASQGFSQATDLAEVIMQSYGLPYLRAHEIVGRLAAMIADEDLPAGQITVGMVDAAAQEVIGQRLGLSPELLSEALDPSAIVATRTGPGGAAPGPMKTMIADCRELLVQIEGWQNATSKRLMDAETELLSLAHRMVLPHRGIAGDERDSGTLNGWKDSADLGTRWVAAESV